MSQHHVRLSNPEIRLSLTRTTLTEMDSSLQDIESDELRGRLEEGSGSREGVSVDEVRRLRV